MAILRPFQIKLASGITATLRSPSIADARALLDLARDVTAQGTWNVTQADEITIGIESQEAWIETHEMSANALMIIAEIDGKLAGTIHFENGPRRRNAHTGEFGMVVREEFRGKGLGGRLLDTLVKWAEKSPDVEKVCLTVHSDNEGAIRLYRKFGFVEEGRKIKGIKIAPGRYLDAILMYKFVKS